MLPEEDYWVAYQRLKERGWERQNYRTEMGVRSATEVTCSVFDPDRHRIQLTAWRNPYQAPAAGRGKIMAGRIEDFPIGSMTHVREGGFFVWRTAAGIQALDVEVRRVDVGPPVLAVQLQRPVRGTCRRSIAEQRPAEAVFIDRARP